MLGDENPTRIIFVGLHWEILGTLESKNLPMFNQWEKRRLKKHLGSCLDWRFRLDWNPARDTEHRHLEKHGRTPTTAYRCHYMYKKKTAQTVKMCLSITGWILDMTRTVQFAILSGLDMYTRRCNSCKFLRLDRVHPSMCLLCWLHPHISGG